MKKLYGWYSQQDVDTNHMKEQYRFDNIKNQFVLERIGRICTYLTVDDKEVRVTDVTTEINNDNYLWPDKVFVGEVVKCIKSVTRGNAYE